MPMCKRPKEDANVIKGPWKQKSKREVVVPDVDVIAIQENIMSTTYYRVFFDATNTYLYPEESLDEVVDPNKVQYVEKDVFLKNLLMTNTTRI